MHFAIKISQELQIEIQEIVEEVNSNGEIIIKGEPGIALTFFLTRG